MFPAEAFVDQSGPTSSHQSCRLTGPTAPSVTALTPPETFGAFPAEQKNISVTRSSSSHHTLQGNHPTESSSGTSGDHQREPVGFDSQTHRLMRGSLPRGEAGPLLVMWSVWLKVTRPDPHPLHIWRKLQRCSETTNVIQKDLNISMKILT